jgi:hypothetical protein
MKNSKRFLAIIILAIVATVVTVVSCKKEKQEQKSYNAEQSVQCSDNMDEYLISFKNKLLSAQKGEETISLEQAQRDLGNLLNFNFGDANFITDEIQYDTIYVPVMLEGNLIDMAQLANTYNIAFANILETYNRVDLPEKSVLYITCSINQNTKNEDDANVRFVLATRGLTHNDTMPPIFDETDNWRVWEQLGKCDGTCVGDDHTTILKKAYNRNRPLLECLNGRLYYTDIDSIRSFGADDYPETNPDIHYNHGNRLWCGWGNEVYDSCVEYPEMRYYYNNLCQIMANEAPRPVGHVTITIIDCFLDYLLSVDPQRYYSFFCKYENGKPNCTNTGPAY